jgi:aspartyl-tRNA(Asn)/glutamyl-tRNA(Gln) amidotransferase subunit B
VLFDPDTGETRAMRTKEDAADYRYFPDPDLPPLVIAADWIERVKHDMPELPRVMAERFVRDYGLPEYDATTLTQSKAMASYFEAVVATAGKDKAKPASNWLMGEVSRRLNSGEVTMDTLPVSAAQLAALITRIADGTISNNAGKQVFDHLWEPKIAELVIGDSLEEVSAGVTALNALKQIDSLIEAKGLKQMNDTGALEKIIDDVLAAHPKNVEEYKAGNAKALNGLVGPIMKASQGKANPQQVNELLKKKLS